MDNNTTQISNDEWKQLEEEALDLKNIIDDAIYFNDGETLEWAEAKALEVAKKLGWVEKTTRELDYDQIDKDCAKAPF